MIFKTPSGESWLGQSEHLAKQRFAHLAGKVNLVLTSPPFPLLKQKRYGNLLGEEYLSWLKQFAPIIRQLLAPDGSVVLEMGNAWEAGRPEMSTLPLRALLEFQEAGDFVNCQQFVWNNPARLPSPAQWVNVERIRVKDSFTHIWWLSATPRPKADNRKVLVPYSQSMKRLLRSGQYNSGRRPSEHSIGEDSFRSNNGGAIPSSVFSFSNTRADSPYLRHCRENGITPHPARMPEAIPEFFVRFLTDVGDLILDPFAGSNTTGAVAESLGRRWIAVERDPEYVRGSIGRFPGGVEMRSRVGGRHEIR